MPIDLKKLAARTIPRRPCDPLEIWNQLDRSVGKEYLRPIQEEVLKQWFGQREQENTIIKMNTGTGKTLVGLLILQSSLNEGYGPALYLCPDNYLVGQVIDQAKQFGVRCASFAADPREIPPEFINGEAILVTNVKKVFNGLSIFGVQGGPRAPVSIGTVLLDDAHACVEQVRSQFSIVMKSDHPAFGKLLGLFAPSLSQQKPGTFAEIQSGDYAKFMAVPYWTWLDSQAEIVRILSEQRDSDELRFVWPLLKDVLSNCDCVISGTHLQISARVTQTHLIPSFACAKRKIYLSATLLDDSQLARDLGVPIDNIRNQIKPNEFDDLGERLMLMPSDVQRDLDTSFVLALMKNGTKLNRIALVPTKRDSERWESEGATPVLASNIEAALEPLKSSKGNFLVLISKYDGVDLPDDMCRILVLDGLPRAATLYDWYLQSVLLGTPTINGKIAQRIEQGLGRATRGKSDYCVVLITGNDLVAFVRNKRNRNHLSAGTNAQLELGLSITGEIRESTNRSDYSKALIQEINRCLRRDDEWKGFYRSVIEAARDGAEKGREDTSSLDVAAAEHAAADLFLKRNYDAAVAQIRSLSERTGLTEREQGWFLQLAACYMYPKDKSQAMSMQKKAFELNGFLFVPPEGIRYHRMAEQAETQRSMALKVLLSYENHNEFVIEANAVCDRLAFGIEAEFSEQALNDVAKVIGIASSRPEKTTGRGPDCLWLSDKGKFLVIEAKSEAVLDRTEIYKSECEQLLHSYEWFRQEYAGKEGQPLLFHPGNKCAREAVFPAEGRVVTPDVLEKFVASVRSYVAAVASKDRAELTEKTVYDQLQANYLLFEQCFSEAQKVRSR